MSNRRKPLIVGLDVVRFTAAAMVMCFHLCTSSWADKSSITQSIVGGGAAFPELFSATWCGWLGVEIFFVISGLVIAYSAESATAFQFLLSRVLRLYPAAWICATITAITILAVGNETTRHVKREWLHSVTLSPAQPYIDPVYWTLGVEISFYTVIFLLLSTKRFRYLERVVLILGCVSSGYWILGTEFAPEFLQQQLWNRTLELSLVAYGCFFGVGALTYLIAREGRSLLRMFAMGVFIAAGLIEVSYKVVDMNFVFHTAESAVLPQCLFLLAIGCIFASMRRIAIRPGNTARLIRLVGLATYPLYLFHQVVGAAIMKAVLAQGGSRYAALISAIVLCLAGSLIIAKVIEPPVRATLRVLLMGISGLPLWDRIRRLRVVTTAT